MSEAAVETSETQPATTPPDLSEIKERAEKLEAQLREEREARVRLEERIKAIGEKPTPEAEKVYTRAELTALVDTGKLTEDQREEILDRQREAAAHKRAEAVIEARIAAHEKSRKVEAERMAYFRTYPEAWKAGTEDRTKLQAEFDYLVSMGDDPADPLTEVKALRAAFGPADRVREKPRRASHEETGGSDESSGSKGSGAFAGIPAKLRTHYEKQIESGLYTGHDDPALKAELKYIRSKQKASA